MFVNLCDFVVKVDISFLSNCSLICTSIAVSYDVVAVAISTKIISIFLVLIGRTVTIFIRWF